MANNKERIQKKMEGPIDKYPGWDPLGKANNCLELLRKDIDLCDSSGAIAHTGCIFGNTEAAFYESEASEDEMISLKEAAVELRHDFSSKCRCEKR